MRDHATPLEYYTPAPRHRQNGIHEPREGQAELALTVVFPVGSPRATTHEPLGYAPTDVRAAAGLTTDAQIAAAVGEAMAQGMSRKDAVAEVAAQAGLPKRRVYDVSLRFAPDS